MITKDKQTEQDIVEMLALKYASPAWAFLPQVRNQTGYSATTRTADAIAMGLWPSRGLHLHGFEIKTYRGDWLSELKNPEKAEEIARHCNFWWLVVSEGVVEDNNEVPAPWGLMLSKGKSLKVLREPTFTETEVITKSFLAAILRKAQECVTPEAKIKEAYGKGFLEGQEDRNKYYQNEKKEALEYKQLIAKFEKTSGVHIDRWCGDDIGEAVRMVMSGEHMHVKRNLEGLLDSVKNIELRIVEALGKKEKEFVSDCCRVGFNTTGHPEVATRCNSCGKLCKTVPKE
jgi:hypothetical protein